MADSPDYVYPITTPSGYLLGIGANYLEQIKKAGLDNPKKRELAGFENASDYYEEFAGREFDSVADQVVGISVETGHAYTVKVRSELTRRDVTVTIIRAPKKGTPKYVLHEIDASYIDRWLDDYKPQRAERSSHRRRSSKPGPSESDRASWKDQASRQKENRADSSHTEPRADNQNTGANNRVSEGTLGHQESPRNASDDAQIGD